MAFSGFYLAYFSAEFGNSIGVFVITEGLVAEIGWGIHCVNPV